MKSIVLGATGYTGMLLVRILARHPDVEEVIAVSSSRAGTPVLDTDPGLRPLVERTGTVHPVYRGIEHVIDQAADVVFSALPHGASAEVAEPFFGTSVVIDLSADFRFADTARYERAYNRPAPLPDLQNRAAYGLVEYHRDEIRSADVIANPGCYPTATLLAVLPLVEDNLVDGTIVVDAISGISGAGRKEKSDLLFAERTENAGAYSPGSRHRHQPEIAEQVERTAGEPLQILFTPHLAPLKQGMVATCTVPTRDPDRAARILSSRYETEPFVSVTGERMPETRAVRGTNRVEIGFVPEERHVVVSSVIDNLWKGASGQAVQNMNVRFGLTETAGLHQTGEL